MQAEGASGAFDSKACRPPPGLEPLGSAPGTTSCKVKGQTGKAVAQRESQPSTCTSYRSVAARAIKQGSEGREKAADTQEAARLDSQTCKSRGGASRSADKQPKAGKPRGNKGGGAKEAGSPPSISRQGERKSHVQERRLQDEIKVLCTLPKLDESLENPQELLKLKTLFVGELENGQPRRRPPIDEATGQLLYWDRRCYSFDSGGATCTSGTQCIFCHTIEELLLHPAKFRSELMASNSENAWHCATSIAELRLRAPEAYGLDAHLRRLHGTQGPEMPAKLERNAKPAAEKSKNKHPMQAVPPQAQKKTQLAKQQRQYQQQQQQQQQLLRQTSGVAPKETKPAIQKPKLTLGEDVRACSSSSTEVNSVEDSCGSSSGCCSGGDCGILCDFAATAAPAQASVGSVIKSSSSGCGKSKMYNVEGAPATEPQAPPEALHALNGVKGGPASPVATCGTDGGVESPVAMLATKGTRLAYTWSDQEGALNLSSFKVFPCRHKHSLSHDKKYCPFYHNFRDKRRFPVTYRAEQCEEHFDLDSSSLQCSKGDACDKSHNRHELLYHPSIFKQRFCSSYATRNGTERCGRGQFCAFAHSREEVRAPLFSVNEETNPSTDFFMQHFKTVWCPYGVQHDWYTCVYAHTYQDCRRSPQLGYGSEPCPAWNKDVHSADYGRRCPHGTLCPYSHGSKEQLYHPSYYKTMPCMDYRAKDRSGVSCPRGILCAFYHEASERRWPLRATIDYSVPLPPQRNTLLQAQFLRPPLFNLDDFEAFGHTSRKSNPRRELLAPEPTNGRYRNGFRRGDSGIANSAKSPPPSLRRRLDQPSGPCGSPASCAVDRNEQQQQHEAQHAQLLLFQQETTCDAVGKIAQQPANTATTSTAFPNAFVSKQQQQTSSQSSEADALTLAVEFAGLAMGASQWHTEAHPQRLPTADTAAGESGRVLLEELRTVLGSSKASCTQAQQQLLQRQQNVKQQALQQLAAGLGSPRTLASTGFGSWLLKQLTDEEPVPRPLDPQGLQGNNTTPPFQKLLKPQDATPVTCTSHLQAEDPPATTPSTARWDILAETASLGGQAVSTPGRSGGLHMEGRRSVIAAPPQTPNACSSEDNALRSVGLYDNSGVWGSATPELSPSERVAFRAPLDQQTTPETDTADELLHLLGKASQNSATPTRSPSPAGGPCPSPDEELSDAAARLPPVPPPILHWYCRQTAEVKFSGKNCPGGSTRCCVAVGAAEQQSQQPRAATPIRAAAEQCEETAMDTPRMEEAGEERLFHSAVNLQRLVTFDSDPGQDYFCQPAGDIDAPLSFSLGMGIATPAHSCNNGQPPGRLCGTHLASLYIVAPAAAVQEKLMLRLARAKISSKMLVLHNAAADPVLNAGLQRSAAKVGHTVVNWGVDSDGGVAFWRSASASFTLREQPSGTSEVGELLERAAACGSHVVLLYVHSSDAELCSACTRLANYCVSPRVIAAQKRLFVLHLCLNGPTHAVRRQLLDHVVTLSLPRLQRWTSLLTGNQYEVSSAPARLVERNVALSTEPEQLQQRCQTSGTASAEEAGALCGERRLLSADDLRAVVSPTCSVYSLPCMHEDLQWNDVHGHAGKERCCSLLQKECTGLICLLRKELETALYGGSPVDDALSNPPCVLVELEEEPASELFPPPHMMEACVGPPGFPALPLSRLRGGTTADSFVEQAEVHELVQEAASLGFVLLEEEDRAVQSWREQLGASFVVAVADGAPAIEHHQHSWANWGARRLSSRRSTSILFRRPLHTQDHELIEGFRLLEEAQAAAGDCRGILRCVKTIPPAPGNLTKTGAAVYLQPPANTRAAGALWVCSLQQLVLCNSPANRGKSTGVAGSPATDVFADGSSEEPAVAAAPCCVCGLPVEAMESSPATTACLHRHHSSCAELLRAGDCWPCPCALLWPSGGAGGHDEEHFAFPSQALRHLILDLCDALTEAHGLLQHIHSAAYGPVKPPNSFRFAVGPKDVIVTAGCDGALSVCVDVASPQVLRAALLSPSNTAAAAQEGTLGPVMKELVSLLLTRGRATSPHPAEAPLTVGLLNALCNCSPADVRQCLTHPFFWRSAERLSFLQVALSLTHLPQQQGLQKQHEGLEGAWDAKLSAHLRNISCTGRSWLLAKAHSQQSELEGAFSRPAALGVLTLVDKLRQRWLPFSSQLTPQEVEMLLKEVGLDTSQQQMRQQQLLLLVQHADEVLFRHVETEAPGLLLAVFLLARADPAVLQVMHASPSLLSLRPALQGGKAEGN